jgi:hypothetical protein
MLQHVTRVLAPEALEECARFYRLLDLKPAEARP